MAEPVPPPSVGSGPLDFGDFFHFLMAIRISIVAFYRFGIYPGAHPRDILHSPIIIMVADRLGKICTATL
jgi:hypothetical protein